MSRINNRGRRFLGIASLCAIGAAMWQTFAFFGNCALAQLKPIPDNSLGAESSVVIPNVDINGINSDRIDGGAIRGANLFHSFQEFNIEQGRGAYFTNPAGIENILSRVTGGNRSEIFGKLGVLGNANLFLINPSGIIFGQNASLDVRGSFVGTTASAIGFGNQGFFSATNPNNPELLTVNPSAFFFNQIAAPIQNNSVASARLPSENFNTFGLRVPDGRSLLLVGGNISMDGGLLNAFGGRVELGGLAAQGTIGLNFTDNNLSSSFPQGVQRADVFLTNRAGVNVRAGGGGSIAINAQNLNLAGKSTLRAGIDSGLGSIGFVAGNVEINATGSINLNDSFIANAVLPRAMGKGGDINITTGSVALTNGGQLNAVTLGQGDAGSVNINAHNTVSFDGVSSDKLKSGASSIVQLGAEGNGGGINITTSSLSVKNGAELVTNTRGRGNAGSVNINARDTVFFDGVDSDGFPSAAASQVRYGAVGNGGSINITAGSLSVTNSAKLSASTRGQGDAGNVTINARDAVSFDGLGSAAFSTVQAGAVGNGGIITVSADSLSLTNGGQLQTLVRGAEDGLPPGQGNAGNVNINVRDTVTISGVNDGLFSGIGSLVSPQVIGNSGNITITSGSLFLSDGARLSASTAGQGDAGNVTITARDTVSFDGVNSDGNPTVALSAVIPGAVGKGGNINVTTGFFKLTNGAQISTATGGKGDAGNVTITAQDSISFNGVGSNGLSSGVYSTVNSKGVGNGGNIRVTTGSLSVTNRAALSASSFGQGAAGNIEVGSNSIRLNNQALIQAITTSGNGGNITLRVRDLLLLRRGSEISTTAGTEQAGGDGGNIVINASNGFVVAVPTENSDITANAYTGSGGNVQINAFGVYGTQLQEKQNPQTSDITASSQFGVNGTVEINTPEIDPNRGLVNLPTVLLDTEVSQLCQPRTAQNQSSFIITGRGGLPPNPRTELLTPDAVQVDWVTLKPRGENRVSTNVSKTISPTPAPIVEAQGWVRNAKGEVVLTAYAPTAIPHNSWQTPAFCHGS